MTRVALLQNFVAPYRVRLYEEMRDRLAAFKVFVSTPMERDRFWQVDWGTLDVSVQNNITICYPIRYPSGFRHTVQVHVPWDTIPRLWRFRPDTIISVELGPRTLQVVLYKLLRPSTRVIAWCKLSEHTELAWGGIRWALRRWILERVDAVLVNGESGARYIARFGLPDERIFRVNQPIDISLFDNMPRQRPDVARTRLLCCGTLTARKGLLPFLRQLDRWVRARPDEQYELWFLGEGDLRPELEAFVPAPNLTTRLIGGVQYDALPGWYSQVDILAFPTLVDEWGLVVNEAMASGLPVLGSIYSQAVTELVTEGVTGWMFDPLSDQSIQAAFDRMGAIRPEALVAMRGAVRQRIENVTPERAAAMICEILEQTSALPREPARQITRGVPAPSQSA